MTVSFIFFNIPVTESPTPPDGTIELQCYLNIFPGHRQCFNRSIHIQWKTEHDTLSTRKRIRIENPSECFSKLFISTKLTDHRRKWRCCVYQNETLKASITHTTTVRGKKKKTKKAKNIPKGLKLSSAESQWLCLSFRWYRGSVCLSGWVSVTFLSQHFLSQHGWQRGVGCGWGGGERLLVSGHWKGQRPQCCRVPVFGLHWPAAGLQQDQTAAPGGWVWEHGSKPRTQPDSSHLPHLLLCVSIQS